MTKTISGASRCAGIIGMALAVSLSLVVADLATREAAAQPAAAKTLYTKPRELGTFGGAISFARDVNRYGQVVGQSQNSARQVVGFFWEGGESIKDVGTLGGATSSARAVNDSGKVVGFSQTTTNQTSAFIADLAERSTDGKLKLMPLGGLADSASSEAWDINDSGLVVGRSYNSISDGRAVLWQNGQPKDLREFLKTPYSEAWGVDDSGQVVGEAGRFDNQGQAFLYDSATKEVTDIGASLDHFPYPYSEAMGINDSGKVVGWSYRGGATPSAQPTEGESFLYDSATGEATYLGALDGDLYSRARAISDSGKVVGLSRGPNGQRAFLWEDGTMKDLNALIPAGSPLKLIDAYAINSSGQIVGSATNKDGQTVPFLLTPDTTEPRVECGTADDLWHREDVNISCTASDDGVGLVDPTDASFTLSTSVPAGTETADAPTDSREVCDAAGNCATAGPISGNKIDNKAPGITITASPSGDEYRLVDDVTVVYECADGGSGVASCSAPVASGDKLDTASVGQKTFTVEASDEAGNAASESFDYHVVYDFGGFFNPVDNPPTVNTVNAGRSVPVKFGLSGNQGLDIFADGYPHSQSIDCKSPAPGDSIEETVAAGAGTLTYDPASDQYNYVWKTKKAWSGTCRQLVVKLMDGSFHRASFELK